MKDAKFEFKLITCQGSGILTSRHTSKNTSTLDISRIQPKRNAFLLPYVRSLGLYIQPPEP